MARNGIIRYLRLKLLAVLLRIFTKFQRKLEKAPPSDRVIENHIRIPSRDPGRFIEACLYLPRDETAAAGPTDKLPILINWHGSGFVVPGLGINSVYCARMVRDTGIAVLDADYRKGPKTAFPGPLLDVEDTIKWVVSQSHRFDLNRVALSGFSVGATLSLVAASSLRELIPEVHIPIVIAVYPVTDLSVVPASDTIASPKRPIPPPVLRFFYDCYMRDTAMRTDPRISPGFADPSLFPDMVVVVTCDGDVLMPQGKALAKRLDVGDRRVIDLTCKRVPHGFDGNCKEGTVEWEERDRAYTLIAQSLKEALRM